MQRKVGILGATGSVGRAAAHAILTETTYPLVIGGRSEDKLRRQFLQIEERIDIVVVDVHNPAQVVSFCHQCHLVLNCAGPSKQIRDRVASICIDQGVHYVDVSGDESIYRHLLTRKHEIEQKKLSVVMGAGVYPGLSEIFPAYIAEQMLEEIELLELFFAGQGGLSLHAAYDIVCSMKEDTSLGMTYCKQGVATPIRGSFHRQYQLPNPAGQRVTYPLLSDEFYRMVKRYPIQAAYFYNTYPNQNVLQQFVMIKALQQYKTEEQIIASARKLTQQFCGDEQQQPDYTLFHLRAHGRKEGNTVKLVSNLVYDGDWNTLSGIVAAHVARLIMIGKRTYPGCFWVAEGVQVVSLIDALRTDHVHLHSISMEGARVNDAGK